MPKLSIANLKSFVNVLDERGIFVLEDQCCGSCAVAEAQFLLEPGESYAAFSVQDIDGAFGEGVAYGGAAYIVNEQGQQVPVRLLDSETGEADYEEITKEEADQIQAAWEESRKNATTEDGIYFSYGAVDLEDSPAPDEAHIAVGKKIVEIAKEIGILTEWNGQLDTRIKILGS